MSNPNSFGDPDTYKGDNWLIGSFDNGGVHINSGVQNFWFYLLVEGGSGVNDNGDAYQVNGIGWEKAADIAYRNLTTYLVPNSQYADAREGALQSAADLFGSCSEEFIATAAAWYAVGVGLSIQNNDLGVSHIEPLSVCGVSDEEYIQIELEYFGCDTFPGGSVLLTYSVTDPSVLVGEQAMLPPMTRGDLFPYQFSQPLTLDQNGEYNIFSKSFLVGDPFSANDTSPHISAFRKGYFSNERVDFENFANSFSVLDSFYFGTTEETSVLIEAQSGTNASFGLVMEGGNTDGYVVPLFADPVLVNTTYTARTCACIDATHMDSLSFSFDLRQTFSPYWEVNSDEPRDSVFVSQRVNILRVMLNEEVLERFTPTSHESDPWVTHTYNLDQYIGQSLSLCFVGTVNQSQDKDNFGIGDRIYLDNINFSSVSTPVSSIHSQTPVRTAHVYPNPASGQLTISYDAKVSQELEVRLLNSIGQLLTSRQWKVLAGKNQLSLSLEGQAAGIYSVQVRDQDGWLVKKIVKEER